MEAAEHLTNVTKATATYQANPTRSNAIAENNAVCDAIDAGATDRQVAQAMGR